MSYTAAANHPNPAAAVGAIGVPAGIAVLLITGLAVKQVIMPPVPNPTGTFEEVIEITPEVIEPETSTSATEQTTSQQTETTITRPESEFDFELTPSGPITDLPGLDEGIGDTFGPVDFGIPKPSPTPVFDPVAAAPMGNPGRWITDRDYRPSWINRGYSGRAGFTLQIDAQGRVTNCSITRSTGHDALDEATCRLLRQRAEFSPAKDSSGRIVPGSYSSSVNWRIP
ncbi:hypothetical protein MACH24_13570 [Erythrobacter sp. Dej080120_24]|uniref:energy transducer TonB n=1 Tax=Erythrobacter sp. Dej080120_24 TaxID=3024837 RepID=UPI00068993D8|nr:hypothetical protein MACH24_13570 [Erythrobacter sp. Dej080120_24]